MRVLLTLALAQFDWAAATKSTKCTASHLNPLLLNGPAQESRAEHWRQQMADLRQACRQEYQFESSVFDEPDMQWTQTSYVQTQMHAFDRYFYDDDSGRYTPDRFLKDLKDRYGGIDAMLLWPTYTNLGADDRNQFDLIRALPGGLDALRTVIAKLRQSGVRTLIPYNPWDNSTRREASSDMYTMAQFVKHIGADGYNGDTMLWMGPEWYEAGKAQGLHVAIEPELGGIYAMANYTPLHWAYWGQITTNNTGFDVRVIEELLQHLLDGEKDVIWSHFQKYFAHVDRVPGVDFFKWAHDARHMSHGCERFQLDKTDYLQVSYFNGVGFESWENVWGIWNQLTIQNSEALRRIATILRFFGKLRYLQSQSWQPHTACKRKSDAVFVSEFPKDSHDRVFLGVNREQHIATVVLNLPHNQDVQYYDCYKGRQLEAYSMEAGMQVSLDVEGRGFACILVTNKSIDGLQDFLALMASLTKTPLLELPNDAVVLKQSMVGYPVHSYEFSEPPTGMLVIPEAKNYRFQVEGTEIEPTNALFEVLKLPHPPSWVLRRGAGAAPVDVQFPWEAFPTQYHDSTFQIPSFFLDKHPISVEEYAKYLHESRYVPKDRYNWLKNWNHSTTPPTAPQGKPPVTYISLKEARAYCDFYNKRLPTDWEWQYAAQGLDGRLYPWGESDNEHLYPDVVRGGILPQPQDIGAYPAGASPFGVEDLVGHVWQYTDEFYDNHTRAVLLRGGSFYRPYANDSNINWYFPSPIRLDRHSKYFLMSDSYERCGTIGFRCAADMSHTISITV